MRRTVAARATDPNVFANAVKAKSPTLLRAGSPPPKVVLSFGGAGFLVTYSLGVAAFLLREKAALLRDSYVLGAGSGALAAVALLCGEGDITVDAIVKRILDDPFNVTDEKRRRDILARALQDLIPSDVHARVSGRLTMVVSFSNRDAGYYRQAAPRIAFGTPITGFDSREDVIECLMAATAPNITQPMRFRGAENVVRGTQMSLSTEVDPYCRHVYIHGYCGMRRNRAQTVHNIFFGRHGFLPNTHAPFFQQVALAFFPHALPTGWRRDKLMAAYEAGYGDAKRYERWEEDAYHFAKPDRSPSDGNWGTLRKALFSNDSATL